VEYDNFFGKIFTPRAAAVPPPSAAPLTELERLKASLRVLDPARADALGSAAAKAPRLMTPREVVREMRARYENRSSLREVFRNWDVRNWAPLTAGDARGGAAGGGLACRPRPGARRHCLPFSPSRPLLRLLRAAARAGG
jgi:hypothetical protein